LLLLFLLLLGDGEGIITFILQVNLNFCSLLKLI
jgi:hypothetical protein